MLDCFDPDKILDKIVEMSPEACKAALIGGIFGFGAACVMLEEVESTRKPANTEYTRKREARNMYNHISLDFDDEDCVFSLLNELDDILYKCGTVTVYDLYSLADLPTNHHMKNWCWDNLTDVEIRHGWKGCTTLIMPPALRLIGEPRNRDVNIS